MNCESETVASALRAWCGEELASWSAKCLPCTEMQEDFGRLNQTKPNVFIFDIRGGIVTLRERPPSLVVGELARQRADRYLGFIQDVVTTYEIDVETTIAFDVGDGGGRVEKAPIFAFQKPAGSEIILFPDIDFLNNNFFTDKSFVDDHEYRAKSTTAIFVGSTSGANNTEQTVINLESPRLRAAMYFKNQPRVEFLLPSIVQCDNEKTRDLIREMGFGQGGRIPWRHQLTHKFIISMDGNGATCSRVVLALRSNSVLLKYSSNHLLYYFPHLIPWQHYIPIESDRAVEDAIQMELDTPGLFERIAVEGQSFAESYLSETAVSQYAAELIRAYAKTFRFRAAITASVAGTNAPMDSTLQDNRFVPLNLIYLGHIQNRGDVNVTDGTWLGEVGSRRSIEGFTLWWAAGLRGISYQTVREDGTLSSSSSRGEFSGTRGRHTPIFGFRINCDGEAEARLRCQYYATFVDGSTVGPVSAGQTCQAESLVPLEALRIEMSASMPQNATFTTDARLPARSDLGPFEDQAKQASAAGPGPDQDTMESPGTHAHRPHLSTANGPLERATLSELSVSSEVLIEATEFDAPACILGTNYPALEPTAGQQHLTQLYVARTHQVNSIRLARLVPQTDLIVAGGEDFIPICDGKILADQVPSYWSEEAARENLAVPRPSLEINQSAVLIARYGLRTWGHWLGELLPKMVCVEAIFPGKYSYILPAAVFSDPVLRPLLESIWYHGIDLSRIVPVQPNTIYRFSELYAVSPAWSRHKIHPGAVELVRAHMGPPHMEAPRKVAFLRTESRTRNLANVSSVIDELTRHGFTMVEIGGLSFAEQVATFAAAQTIVGVLGSGLSGMLYSPAGVRVLTLAPSRWSDLFFFALMQNRDARLVDIRGQQDPADNRRPAVASFNVEIPEIQKGLRILAESV